MWKNVKKTRKNYALFYDGKIGVAYSDKKSEYISDSTYGIWDNIVDFEIDYCYKENKYYVYAVTDSGKVKTTDTSLELSYYSWDNICKIYLNSYPKVLIGLEKDGTAHVTSSDKRYDCDNKELCLNLSRIKNICDIQFFSDSIFVLTADGKVVELLENTYLKKTFPGLEDWEDIIQIRVEYTHIIGLKSNGTVVGIKADNADVRPDCCATENWTDIVTIFSSTNLSIGLKATGDIVSCGKDSQKYNARICYNVFRFEEECEKMLDHDNVSKEAIYRAEQEGIIFIDEIDKIAAKKNNGQDVSREGVQRDILPIVEGSVVNTKYGVVHTDHILFIAAGAFHISSVSDLIPELQGRFPIQVELNSLDKGDFIKILTIPQNALIKQYQELLKVDNINLVFTDDAIEKIAYLAELENETKENIGARRLQTIMEALVEDISFNASDENPLVDVTIDALYVENTLKQAFKDHDYKKYIL